MKKSIFFLLMCLFPFLLSAVEAGGKLPDVRLNVPKWFGTEPPLPQGKKDQIEVVMFFDAGNTDSVSFIRMLEALVDKYAENGQPVRLSAVSRNTLRMTGEFINEHGPFGLMIGADDQRKFYQDMASSEPVMPFSIIARAEKVIWTGFPTDIESVTDRILSGKFDSGVQGQVASLRRELQSALQASLPDVITRTSDKILDLLPGDSFAVQAKLFVYNSRGKTKEAKEFIKEVTEKASDDLNMRILYLDLLLANNENKEFGIALSKAVADFDKLPGSLFRLLAFSMETAPHGTLPLETIYPLSDRIREAFSDAHSDKKALSLEFSARASSMVGDMDSAVKYQAEATELRKGSSYENAAKDLLEYYKTAKKLGGR